MKLHKNIEEKKEEKIKKIESIHQELLGGIEAVEKFDPTVTFYGSARLKPENPYYQKVKNLASRISQELNFIILSGGGGGLMEAANKGAFEVGGQSVGLTIKLPKEQETNLFVTDEIPFQFFFTRQSCLYYATEVCIFCPGGFGTLFELFEMLTLQQTKKIGSLPIILYGSDFWQPIEKIIKEVLLEKYKTISPEDLNLYRIIDDEDAILEIIKNSKNRDGQDALI